MNPWLEERVLLLCATSCSLHPCSPAILRLKVSYSLQSPGDFWGMTWPTVYTGHDGWQSAAVHALRSKTRPEYDSAKLSSSISAAGQIAVLGQGFRGFGGSAEVDGWAVSGWGWEIEGMGLWTDDLLGTKTNTTLASCTVHALLPPLYTSPHLLVSTSVSPHLYLSVTPSVCLSLTHSSNHHRVLETEGDCGFVC